MTHDHQTEGMLEAERLAGWRIETKEELEVRLGVLRALLVRKRWALVVHIKEIDLILGEQTATQTGTPDENISTRNPNLDAAEAAEFKRNL